MLVVLCKNSLPNLRAPRFSPVFSSGSVIVFSFILRSMIHFELTFIKGSQSMSGFNLIFECPTGQHH